MTAAERLCLRQTESKPILEKLHSYLEKIQEEVLPKSPAGRWITGPFRLQPTSSFEAGLQPKVTTPDLRSEVPRSGAQN